MATSKQVIARQRRAMQQLEAREKRTLAEIRKDLQAARNQLSAELKNYEPGSQSAVLLTNLRSRIERELAEMKVRSQHAVNEGQDGTFSDALSDITVNARLGDDPKGPAIDVGINREAIERSKAVAKDLIGEEYDDLAAKATRTLRLGIAGGLPRQEIEKRLDKTLRGTSIRAETVARTYVNGANNTADQVKREQLESRGVRTRKTWVCAGALTQDGRSRPEHLALHSVTVDADEPFPYPGLPESQWPMHPGDEALPIEHRANCRCTTVTTFEELEGEEDLIADGVAAHHEDPASRGEAIFCHDPAHQRAFQTVESRPAVKGVYRNDPSHKHLKLQESLACGLRAHAPAYARVRASVEMEIGLGVLDLHPELYARLRAAKVLCNDPTHRVFDKWKKMKRSELEGIGKNHPNARVRDLASTLYRVRQTYAKSEAKKEGSLAQSEVFDLAFTQRWVELGKPNLATALDDVQPAIAKAKTLQPKPVPKKLSKVNVETAKAEVAKELEKRGELHMNPLAAKSLTAEVAPVKYWEKEPVEEDWFSDEALLAEPSLKRMAATNRWASQLSETESDGIDAWTSEDWGAIRGYQQGLTKKKPPYFDEYTQAVESAPLFKGVVYRGIAVDGPEIQKMLKAGVVEFEADSSATASRTTSLRFAGPEGDDRRGSVIFEMKTHSGADIRSMNEDETEVIVRKGTKFKVAGYDTVKVYDEEEGETMMFTRVKLEEEGGTPKAAAKEPKKPRGRATATSGAAKVIAQYQAAEAQADLNSAKAAWDEWRLRRDELGISTFKSLDGKIWDAMTKAHRRVRDGVDKKASSTTTTYKGRVITVKLKASRLVEAANSEYWIIEVDGIGIGIGAESEEAAFARARAYVDKEEDRKEKAAAARKMAEVNAARKEPERLSGPRTKGLDLVSKINSSGVAMDGVTDLYSDDPASIAAGNFDLDTVRDGDVQKARDHFQRRARETVEKKGVVDDDGFITVYRGASKEYPLPNHAMASVTLDRATAQRFADRSTKLGREGMVKRYKVHIDDVKGYSEAATKGTFHEEELIVTTGKLPGGGQRKPAPGSQLPTRVFKELQDSGVTKLPEVGATDIVFHEVPEKERAYRAMATWRDKAGKLQHTYTPEFHERTTQQKWERVEKVEPQVEAIVTKVRKTTRDAENFSREEEGAVVTSVIAETALRPGSTESAVHGHFGISTLQKQHVKFKGGNAELSFIGKSGKLNTTVVTDEETVTALRRYHDRADHDERPLFSSSALQAARGTLPKGVKLKDLRTVKATQVARSALDEVGKPKLTGDPKKDKKTLLAVIKEASAKVAATLNNTPAVARASYIHPKVFEDWMKKNGIPQALIA